MRVNLPAAAMTSATAAAGECDRCGRPCPRRRAIYSSAMATASGGRIVSEQVGEYGYACAWRIALERARQGLPTYRDTGTLYDPRGA